MRARVASRKAAHKARASRNRVNEITQIPSTPAPWQPKIIASTAPGVEVLEYRAGFFFQFVFFLLCGFKWKNLSRS